MQIPLLAVWYPNLASPNSTNINLHWGWRGSFVYLSLNVWSLYTTGLNSTPSLNTPLVWYRQTISFYFVWCPENIYSFWSNQTDPNTEDFSLTGRTRVLDILSGGEDQKIPRAWHWATASPPQAGVVDLETDSVTPTENLLSHLQKPARGHDSQSKMFSRSAKTEPEIFI